jgi:hypothetical protein
MTEITTGGLARLFDTTPKTIAELAKREIIMSAGAGNWSQASAATSGIFAKWRRAVAATMASKRAHVLARHKLIWPRPRRQSYAVSLSRRNGRAHAGRSGRVFWPLRIVCVTYWRASM